MKNTNKILITQSNYIPWKGYFDSIAQSDVFVVYDDMQYTKRDWRNRNLIKTQNGTKWLSIPIDVKGKYLQKINESTVSDPQWNRNHYNILIDNYRKAKCFNEVKNFIEHLYLTNQSVYLTEINIYFITQICNFLGIHCNIKLSSEFELVEGKTEKLVGICKQLNGTNYLTGPAAKEYLDEELFSNADINIQYFDYSNYREYDQIFPPFVHAVSIIDLIFSEGNNAKFFLKSSND